MRIIKSAVAVFICFMYYFFFRKNGIIFYSQLAALWCMQPNMNNTKAKAAQRTIKGKYDVLIEEYDYNKVVRTLKKMYEPSIFACGIHKK